MQWKDIKMALKIQPCKTNQYQSTREAAMKIREASNQAGSKFFWIKFLHKARLTYDGLL